ncbi:hypothetical protein HDU85_005535 [Gaertneriomyces sp. JEL0708]|nr:hypothetical protein HDU85_005535 [Gaertneriomyces sp. JEL0708]
MRIVNAPGRILRWQLLRTSRCRPRCDYSSGRVPKPLQTSRQGATDSLGVSSGHSFFGPVTHDVQKGTLIYTGALNDWIRGFKIAAGITTVISLGATGVLLSAGEMGGMEVTAPGWKLITFVGLTATIPWAFAYFLSSNYVTSMYSMTPHIIAAARPKGTIPPQARETLALETYDLLHRPRLRVVPLAQLRYKPRWVTRVWETEDGKQAFWVDPALMKVRSVSCCRLVDSSHAVLERSQAGAVMEASATSNAGKEEELFLQRC